MKIRAFFQQPYPFYYEGTTFYRLLGALFLMALGFNYLFEPFHVHHPEHLLPYFFISAIHALVASLTFFGYYLILECFPGLKADWTVGKEFMGLSCFLLATGIFQFLIRDLIYDNPGNWSMRYLWEEIRNTFLVGIVILGILVPLNFNRLLQRNQRMAQHLLKKDRQSGPDENLLIKTQLKTDDFYLRPMDLIYAMAEGNYVMFYIRTGDRVEKKLKRISISELESQLAHLPYILRTHRSYLVNTNQISHISGNAQGYKLVIKGVEEKISVSRNMIARFNEHMK